MNIFNVRFNVAAIGLLAAIIFPPHSALAYNVYRTCGGNTVTFSWQNPNNVTFFVDQGDINTSRFNSMAAAASEFDKIGGVNLDVNLVRDGGSHVWNDGRNSIYWNDANMNTAGLGGGTIGFAKFSGIATAVNTNCAGVVNSSYIEADVWLRQSASWTTGNSMFLANGQPTSAHIGRTVMHELGHLVGLSGRNRTQAGNISGHTSGSHEQALVTTMNSAVPFGNVLGGNRPNNSLGSFRNKLHADDAAGLRIMYGDGTNRNDLAASRYFTNLNGTATIRRSVLQGKVLRRGTNYTLGYTVENLGTTQRAAQVEVWVTQDGRLNGTGSDIRIMSGTANFNMAATGLVPANPHNNNAGNRTTRQANLNFAIPNDASTFPNNSLWAIGYRVRSIGVSDADPSDNWVVLKDIHRITN